MTNTVRENRERLNLPRHVVARLIGKSPSWLWTVEVQALEPKPDDRHALAKALQVSEIDLFPPWNP